jgi:hypothetical protein
MRLGQQNIERDAMALIPFLPRSDPRGQVVAVRTETDTYNVVNGDAVIVCNKGSAMTVNLQAASGSGRVLEIKNIGAGTVTVDGASSETIDGAGTKDVTQWQSLRIVDYASGAWAIL